MIIFVYGEDPLFPKRKVAVMKARFEEKYDPSKMNAVHFTQDGEEISLADVISAVQTPPFLGDKRFVVVEGLLDGLLKKEATTWAESLKVPESTILVFLDAISPDKLHKHPLFLALKNAGVDLHDYGYSSGNLGELSTFIRDEVALSGAEIDSQAVQALVSSCGASPSRLYQELMKLISFVGKGRIDRALVERFVIPMREEQLFRFVDAVVEAGRERALPFLVEQREAGLEDGHMLAMLIRQSRLLLRASSAIESGATDSARLARELGISPFQARTLLPQAKRFTWLRLAKIHRLAFDIEARLKRGKIDYPTAVERLILAFTANP